MKPFVDITLNELYHHGIKGQSWGKRNGPPYPLDAEDHNVKERSQGTKGWTKEAKDEENKKKFQLSDKQKKYLKIGAGIVAGALIAYGGYKLYQNKDLLLKEIKLGRKNVDFIRNSGKFDYLTIDSLGGSKFIDKNMVKSINKSNLLDTGGQINCVNCSVSYILNSKFNMNTTAKAYAGIDEISGMQAPGRSLNFLHSIFDNINRKDISESSFDNLIKNIDNNSKGCLAVTNRLFGYGHMINYEKSASGLLTIIDSQSGEILDYSKTKELLNSCYTGNGIIYDLSNSTLKDSAKDILKYVINS